MAFLRYARSNVVKPKIYANEWDKIRVASSVKRMDYSLKEQAERVLGEPFSPDKYLLTHSTIVCSVDAVDGYDTSLGEVTYDGEKINRRYTDYKVTTETDQFINNNMDCWSRGVIEKSYKSFIGAHNFVEHIQVEELSKGRIVDAVLRDIGESLYVDILVATNKKHTELVEQILSGQMNAMSMGCFIAGSQVSLSNGKRIAIEEIQPGEKVITHQGNTKEVLNKQMRKGKWNMRTIKVQGISSPITATDNHPFFVVRPFDTCQCGCGQALDTNKHKDPYRKLAIRYIKGHNLNVSNPAKGKVELPSIDYNVIEVRADEIKKGDLVFFPRRKDTENHISNNRARLLGYFLAEGSFLKHNGEVSAVEFNFSIQERDTFVKEVADLMLIEFGKEAKIYNREDRNTTSIRVHSKEVAQWFKSHGGEYSDKKNLSDEVMSWSNENHLNLLGTFINGDGTLHRIHGHTSLTSCSEQLVNQFHTLLANNGIQSRLSKVTLENRKPAYTLTIGKIQAIALKEYTAKVSSLNVHTSNSLKSFNDKVLYKVDNIKSHDYEGWVYDLEVEDDHSYIVNGVSVHNCSVDFTVCTKCGNVAADETEMCKHIKYEKGNVFYDEKGQPHRVAELCGHETENPNGGVTFIEASWVATPAFKGAVARNVLEVPTPFTDKLAKEEVISKKAHQVYALTNNKLAGPFDDMDFGGGGGDAAAPAEGAAPAGAAPAAPSPFDDLQKELQTYLVDKIKNKLMEEFEFKLDKKKKDSELDMTKSSVHENDTIIREANTKTANHTKVSKVVKQYNQALNVAIKVAKSDLDALKNISYVNDKFGIRIPSHLYKLANKLGSANQYGSLDTFLIVANEYSNKPLKQNEKMILVRFAKLLSTKNTK
jgi:intein/homing endonuclease